MRVQKQVIIAITSMLTIIAVFAGFLIFLHVNARQKEDLRESALSSGPWARQSVWDTADGQAYLLSQKADNKKISAVTAYFYINKTWYQFQVNMTYGNTLIFTDESGTERFTGKFDIEDCVFTVKNLKATDENGNMPPNIIYTFSEVKNYNEEISEFPFNS